MSFNDPQWGRSAGSDKPRDDEQDKQNTDRTPESSRDEEDRRQDDDRRSADAGRGNFDNSRRSISS